MLYGVTALGEESLNKALIEQGSTLWPRRCCAARPTMLKHAPHVRLPRLTTHGGPMTPLVCVGVAFRCGQNFAGSGLCALSSPSERRVARAGQPDGGFHTALSPRVDLLGQKIAFR